MNSKDEDTLCANTLYLKTAEIKLTSEIGATITGRSTDHSSANNGLLRCSHATTLLQPAMQSTHAINSINSTHNATQTEDMPLTLH